jgi:predicted AAA+ superfamily ATPase
MGDTGLLVSLALGDKTHQDNDLYQAILLDKLHINEGMLAENIVAQMLRAKGHKLYFYSRADSKSRANTMEIDFLVLSGGKISPVEVKSGRYQKHASLDKLKKKFGSRLAESYILYTKDIMVKDDICHLPLYMAMFL